MPFSGPAGIGVAVARVLDQRRVRRRVVEVRQRQVGSARQRGRHGQAGRQPRLAGRAGRRVHVDRELRPVARREVAVAVVRDRLVVDVRIPWRRGIGVHRDRSRLGPAGGGAHAVSPARWHVAEQQPAERVRALRVEGRSVGPQQRHARVRRQACDVDLLGAPVCAERCLCGRTGGVDHDRHKRAQQCAPQVPQEGASPHGGDFSTSLRRVRRLPGRRHGARGRQAHARAAVAHPDRGSSAAGPRRPRGVRRVGESEADAFRSRSRPPRRPFALR